MYFAYIFILLYIIFLAFIINECLIGYIFFYNEYKDIKIYIKSISLVIIIRKIFILRE